MERSENENVIVDSSGDVFKDLGLGYDEEDLLKVKLASAISCLLQEQGLTQVQAAKILGVSQGNLSRLIRGRIKGFSVDRLFEFLRKLDRDIDISIHKKPRHRPSRISVRAA